jgi:hypothetical protein
MNSEPQNLFSGWHLRDAGISQAESHANEVFLSWSDKAYSFLIEWIRGRENFMTEEVREASTGTIPEPPSGRAWGAVVLRAVRSGKIARGGFRSVKNPKAHCTPATLWVVL